MSGLRHLFSPFQLAHVTVRNRIVSTPHDTHFGTDGYITQRYIDYYAEKARGGAGLLQCFGSMTVHPSSPWEDWGVIKNWDDSSLPMFEQFAGVMHEHGAVVMAQITHRGRRGNSEPAERPLVAPSPIPERVHRDIPHELEKEQIHEIVGAYAEAALRLKRAGFDGVDVPVFARHLIDQFIIPSLNRRSDEYGGSFENRMRFCVEVLEAVRAAVGRDFIVGVRLSGDEQLKNGLKLGDAVRIAEYLDELRLLDYFSVTGGSTETAQVAVKLIPDGATPEAVYADFAAEIRRAVQAPVLYVARVVDPRQADRLIGDGVCDLVGMTRALMADAHMPNKAREGRLEDIRYCLGMQQGCLGRNSRGLLLSCSQNPVTGREAELAEIEPATVRRRVVVIGGGPAGLEAARTAALRGHQVILFEREPELGGQVRTAGLAPLRPGWDRSADWLSTQVVTLGVDVRTGRQATALDVLAEHPDAVIVATGARPRRPELPGVDLPGVVTVDDVLTGSLQSGDRCVVVDDIGTVNAGLAADFLARRGWGVTIVTPYHCVADAEEKNTKEPLYEQLYARGVEMRPDLEFYGVERVDRGLEVVLENPYTSVQEMVGPLDAVVLSFGGAAVDGLYHALKGKVSEVHLVGDAMAPRTMHDAILEGTRVGRRI